MRITKTLITATHQLYDSRFIFKKFYRVEIRNNFQERAASDHGNISTELLKVIDLPENFNRMLAISGRTKFYLLQVEDEFKTVLDPSIFLIDEIKAALKYGREMSSKHRSRFLAYKFKLRTTKKIAKIYSVISVLDHYVKLTASYSTVLTALNQSDLSIGISVASVEDLFFVIYHFRKYGMLMAENTDFDCLVS
ncbi:MAG: hypothetical protein IM594_07455 [Cytophagales bacterium]|jgi:hypothetical protein|nr:hypothetical protein [Cytophagales bacterium]MCA6387563.1 hypothetical protein [Cytophagales bacterium]MCA6390318.1 hypothetical protein [Cytophagales bacterium]MCA6400626.1 hypothetical protein [Cytophagales bacterium]MCA6405429.1 hypothetical protein [Cytophagales bacterium]